MLILFVFIFILHKLQSKYNKISLERKWFMNYKTSEEITKIKAVMFLQVSYAIFYIILGVPFFIISLSFLISDPSLGLQSSYFAMLILGILFCSLGVLSIITIVLLREELTRVEQLRKLILVLEWLTLNFYGYIWLKPKTEKQTKNKVE